MSNTSNVGDNPNDKMPPGKPLEPDQVAETEDGDVRGDDGFGVVDDDEEEDAST